MKRVTFSIQKLSFVLFLLTFSLFLACTPNKKQGEQTDKGLDTLLAKGKMTAELLWKFGRINEMQLSPDGKSIVYTIAKYNLQENKGKTKLYIIPTEGGEPTVLAENQTSISSPLWRPDGKKIAFLASDGGLSAIWEINPDGSQKQKISHGAYCEIKKRV